MLSIQKSSPVQYLFPIKKKFAGMNTGKTRWNPVQSKVDNGEHSEEQRLADDTELINSLTLCNINQVL